MVGTTLLDIREHLEDLATADGGYYLRCGRTGDRPVPAADLRFDERDAARDAARATEQYRSTLRQYDPRLPYYDVVVCEDAGPMISPREVCHCREYPEHTLGGSDSEWTISEPVLDGAAEVDSAVGGGAQTGLIECCHHVAAAVFEALSACGHEDVERAIMDAYFEHAETIERPDELCCCLLESLASELEAHLEPHEQRTLIETAAGRLDPAEDPDRDARKSNAIVSEENRSIDEIEAGFAALSARGLIGEYRYSPLGVDRETRSRTVQVECSTYALREQDGRLPVLPIVLELFRRAACPPTTVDVGSIGEGWRMTFELSPEATANGLATAPVTTES